MYKRQVFDRGDGTARIEYRSATDDPAEVVIRMVAVSESGNRSVREIEVQIVGGGTSQSPMMGDTDAGQGDVERDQGSSPMPSQADAGVQADWGGITEADRGVYQDAGVEPPTDMANDDSDTDVQRRNRIEWGDAGAYRMPRTSTAEPAIQCASYEGRPCLLYTSPSPRD